MQRQISDLAGELYLSLSSLNSLVEASPEAGVNESTPLDIQGLSRHDQEGEQ